MSFRRLIATLWMGLMVAMAGAAITALAMKRRLIPNASPDADQVALVAIFEPIMFESRATSFRGGEAEFWFGGGIVDLRKATLDPSGATLRVRTIFGGCQLLVPETWQVTSRVLGIGGAGDGRPRIERAADAPRLTVEGTAFFGGVGVMSDIPAEAVRSVREAVAKRGRHVDDAAGVQLMEPETVRV